MRRTIRAPSGAIASTRDGIAPPDAPTSCALASAVTVGTTV
jgi:hypothetical protein